MCELDAWGVSTAQALLPVTQCAIYKWSLIFLLFFSVAFHVSSVPWRSKATFKNTQSGKNLPLMHHSGPG